MFSTVLAQLTLFGFCFLCVYFGNIFFSQTKLVLINLTKRKFALTSVLRIHTKICELLVHWTYDHLYIPLNSK